MRLGQPDDAPDNVASRAADPGEATEFGHTLNASMPLSAGRRFEVLTKRTNLNPESNRPRQ